jgi:transcriptional regulator with XRE-family HTH domain
MTAWDGLGSALAQLRQRARLTPEQVAAHCGIEAAELRRWEGEVAPNLPLDTLGSLLEVYQINLRTLATLLTEPVPGSERPAEPPRTPISRNKRLEAALRALVEEALDSSRR